MEKNGMSIFLNSDRRLRNIWWVAIFFIVLASLTFPVILLSQSYKWEITMAHQAFIVVAATWICQLLRRRSVTEVIGKPDLLWLRNLGVGMIIGSALMLVPASVLGIGGFIRWEYLSPDADALLAATGTFLAVAVAEEFMFRGFIFQRLIGSIGVWGAQILLAAYFLLTHMNNPGMTGSIQIMASVNIFLASLLFGFAFVRTRSLAMPIGIHFMANWVQGTLLGFGVSGTDSPAIVQAVCSKGVPMWLTGGSFGLEASLPGLVCVIITLAIVYKWKRLASHGAAGAIQGED